MVEHDVEQGIGSRYLVFGAWGRPANSTPSLSWSKLEAPIRPFVGPDKDPIPQQLQGSPTLLQLLKPFTITIHTHYHCRRYY